MVLTFAPEHVPSSSNLVLVEDTGQGSIIELCTSGFHANASRTGTLSVVEHVQLDAAVFGEIAGDVKVVIALEKQHAPATHGGVVGLWIG